MRVVLSVLVLLATALANPLALEEQEIQHDGKAVITERAALPDEIEGVTATENPGCNANHCLLPVLAPSASAFCSSYISFSTVIITAAPVTTTTTITTTTITTTTTVAPLMTVKMKRHDEQDKFMSMCSHSPSALSSPPPTATVTPTTTATETVTSTSIEMVETCRPSGAPCDLTNPAACCGYVCCNFNPPASPTCCSFD
ncbi:hypothetical protein CONLIGDRAFT_646318 [Coniochaeta ligniaria NRRL 30616]|uniref:WAP domain-containing protein n=1 Tax=Coniochaeta ligniaria NRRL 30616 TaxID=1408157 RepID=A0A1J7J4B6_9PEZI|nr:hypothetical protein CONLIGDRAFT_646318 [Coniochaeta ligniaria NRRL 30616]